MMLAVRAALVLALGACTTPPTPEPFEARLAGNAIVLLGEVHDNAALHARRAAILERALARGWRPALLLEQLDREDQGAVDRARREATAHPERVLELAPTGWTRSFYRPLVELAARYQLPIVAVNLSREDGRRAAREGLAAVFDPGALARLGLDRPVPGDWQAAMEREIDAGHCHALPPAHWPALARVQFARDAVMAEFVRRHAERGVVLLAGNGHVRRDLGVPRWLRPELRQRTFVVGFVEAGDAPPPAAFDAVVVAPPPEREDPCAVFEGRSLDFISAPRGESKI